MLVSASCQGHFSRTWSSQLQGFKVGIILAEVTTEVVLILGVVLVGVVVVVVIVVVVVQYSLTI